MNRKNLITKLLLDTALLLCIMVAYDLMTFMYFKSWSAMVPFGVLFLVNGLMFGLGFLVIAIDLFVDDPKEKGK